MVQTWMAWSVSLPTENIVIVINFILVFVKNSLGSFYRQLSTLYYEINEFKPTMNEVEIKFRKRGKN